MNQKTSYTSVVYSLQYKAGDDPTDAGDIRAADKLKAYMPHAGKPQIQLAVQIEYARGLYGKRLNLTVGAAM